MAKKASSVRMNITVPADIKRRMDKAADDVNWSAVATQAFMLKLGEIAQQKEKKQMVDVIERLRASKLKGDSKAYSEGVEFGESWAKGSAEAGELQRLSKLYAEWDNDTSIGGWDGFFREDTPWDHRGLTGHIFIGIHGEDTAIDELSFWEEVFGVEMSDYINNPQAVKGFADGALKVWWEVESQL